MARPVKWTEEKIQCFHEAGRGRGLGRNYTPWLTVQTVSSSGRSHRVFSQKTGRVHHLLSDIEYRLFIALEWQREIVDIREQYPLCRESTQSVALELGIRHPYYPGTYVPTVMTVDFLVTRLSSGSEIHEAYDAKAATEAEDARSMEKLEIHRRCLLKSDIPHHVVFDDDIPNVVINNIAWIRDSMIRPNESEPFPDFWSSIKSKFQHSITRVSGSSIGLADYCNEFDANHGVQTGTALRAARMLIADRKLVADLASTNIPAIPAANFLPRQFETVLRIVGGQS